MEEKLSRIRCFICKRLVTRYVIPQDLSIPAAVFTKKIGNKYGCICSACIEEGAYILADLQKRYLNSQKEQEQEQKTNEEENPAVAVSPQDEEALLLQKKYQALNYSLDSIVNLASTKVFGQKKATQKVAYVIFKNLVSNLHGEFSGKIKKHLHIFLIGNTGTGKTLIAETVTKIFGLPYVRVDCSAFTSAAYVGESVESSLYKLYEESGQNLELAENGVIILDELDKKKKSLDQNGKDVSGLDVQQELLKFFESSTIYLSIRKQEGNLIKITQVPFHTARLTIIGTGACVGLDEIIKERLGLRKMGFKDTNVSTNQLLKLVTPDDLIEYGMIPELIGRIPYIVSLNDLDESVMMDIIYQKLTENSDYFNQKGFYLYVDDFLVQKMAFLLTRSKTGARDVNRMVEELLEPALYQVFQSTPNGICEIHEDSSIELLKNKKTRDKDTAVLCQIPPREEYLFSLE